MHSQKFCSASLLPLHMRRNGPPRACSLPLFAHINNAFHAARANKRERRTIPGHAPDCVHNSPHKERKKSMDEVSHSLIYKLSSVPSCLATIQNSHRLPRLHCSHPYRATRTPRCVCLRVPVPQRWSTACPARRWPRSTCPRAALLGL